MASVTTHAQPSEALIPLLLVDDRRENLLALEAILSPLGHELVLAQSGEEAIARSMTREFAAILLDVRMPGIDGFATARQIKTSALSRLTPIIFLTANDSPEDVAQAYAHGGIDFMSKPLNPAVLTAKVSIFVELFQQRAQIARQEVERLMLEQRADLLREHARLLALDAEVARALGAHGNIKGALGAVAQAIVRHLDSAFARIWIASEDGAILELQASAGMYTHLDGAHGRVPVGSFKIGKIGKTRTPHLTNQVIGDPDVGDQAWATREQMVAFAGYPLVIGDELVGVIATFARHPFPEATLLALQSISGGVAQGIERLRAEARQQATATWFSTTLSGIGDGVIATDAHGRVSFLNPVASELTGWPAVDANGRLLDEVFRIETEGTRHSVESPVRKVIREGTVVGMANHTVLLRRDGSEIPIADSAAPIRDAAGTLIGVVLVFRDASDQRRVELEREALLAEAKRAHREAQDARDHLHSLFMQAPTPICIFRGPEHRFELTNPKYCELVGNRDLIGLPVREALPEGAGQGYFELLDRVYTTGEPFEGHEMPAKIARAGTGELVEAVVSIVYEPYRDADGKVSGILVIAADVTDTVRARQALEQIIVERERLLHLAEDSREKADVANRMKDEFLATASHELRTPLNAILGWARMLRSGQLDQSGYMRGLETIERNAKAQVQLIEDILDGSRMITGKLHLEPRPLDMTALVRAALDAVRPAVDAKNIVLSVVVDPAAASVQGDPERLQQVIWNLANNAVKFTPKGGAIEVRLERSGTHIELSITDNGEGIDPAFLPHVFERFRQADGSTTRRHGGLGLGLALVRHIVEAHGGNVVAESAGEGKGSRFRVLLPVRAVHAEPLPDADAKARRPSDLGMITHAPPRLDGITILVVDDEADARDMIATMLRANGAEVTTAATAALAIDSLTSSTPMVVISDVGMPDKDGYDLIRDLRYVVEAGRTSRIPAIALTAYSRDEDRRRTLEAGFDAHVVKPVDPGELVRIVAGAVKSAMPRESPVPAPVASLDRADTLSKFEKILARSGVHDSLRFLNSRTSHRFTGIFRFDGAMLRNVVLVDADSPDVHQGDDAPMTHTYCSAVGESQRTLTIDDARQDDRLREHPARETVVSYCGVLLRDDAGKPFGTLCHFDFVPCDVPARELVLMESAAPRLMKALRDQGTSNVR